MQGFGFVWSYKISCMFWNKTTATVLTSHNHTAGTPKVLKDQPVFGTKVTVPSYSENYLQGYYIH